ncbi:integrase arm-type DNA-binding domain-containing protein [Ancylobacter dichloromethanicus]|uniref:Phage integrase n=1 Tax=Ancylobacter dichloromethanicus TaxID=518825 RepID=A0A9W6MYZ8_9HYPH|nr:site-specific integrase [Ancylobacter dichloromethanicus]MBS7554435.1 integrase arm-type DNA-binding domain-containing protein [Ancylobacter dichloromethanicus]GLK71561.1 phage integrase [Ancylobacter dichloromethanicus]
MRGYGKLSALQVSRIAEPGRYGDGGGLWLQVTPAGTKSWLFRFMLDGRARQMGLGSLSDVTLAEAREAARGARRMASEGIDPIDARAKQRAEARAARLRHVTFRDCAERYVTAHEAGWRNPKHRDQWRNTLTSYADPIVGDLAIGQIDTALVLKVLEPIWRVKPETASRTRGRIEAVLDWAQARGYRQGENPARWRGHLDKLLPSKAKVRRVEHHGALPFLRVPAFVAALRAKPFVSAKALEFTILTAARTGEVIGARWHEIDLGEASWTVPAERMKAGREHRVPLSPRTVEMLRSLPREDGGFVFPGAKAKSGLSNMAMLQLVRGMDGTEGLTVHGFRSAFRDWASEQTDCPREVAEAALAHTISDKVEAAYRRGDLFDKRRRLMEDWATFCRSSARG